jgi:type VI secretion system (T6SS) effector TldE1-like protein
VFGGLALVGIACASAWTVYANVFATRGDAVAPPPTVTVLTARPTAPAVTVVPKQPAEVTRPNVFTAPSFDVALLDTRPIGQPRTFAQSAPMKTALQRVQAPVQQVAQSAPRPANAALQAAAKRGKFDLASSESTPITTSAFEKLFGKRDNQTPELAYAAPNGGVANDGKSLAGQTDLHDGFTAVYDISAHMVYMPDGTRLEAHSGYRDKLDDPRYVHVRMRGATPPHTYDLTLRESLFHGVQALRLTPVGGEGAVFGRAGLLAHTYMLGPNGDSNGCVSFRDYEAFLRAFRAGKVKRLVVVVNGGRALMASN